MGEKQRKIHIPLMKIDWDKVIAQLEAERKEAERQLDLAILAVQRKLKKSIL